MIIVDHGSSSIGAEQYSISAIILPLRQSVFDFNTTSRIPELQGPLDHKQMTSLNLYIRGSTKSPQSTLYTRSHSRPIICALSDIQIRTPEAAYTPIPPPTTKHPHHGQTTRLPTLPTPTRRPCAPLPHRQHLQHQQHGDLRPHAASHARADHPPHLTRVVIPHRKQHHGETRLIRPWRAPRLGRDGERRVCAEGGE